VAKFKYLRTTKTHQNCIRDAKNILNLGNACYQAVQNILSSRLISKNVKIKIYKIVDLISPLVLFEYETWPMTLREEHRLSVCEDVVSSVFEPKMEKVTGDWRNCTSFIICRI
jgi:hypothetical protein